MDLYLEVQQQSSSSLVNSDVTTIYQAYRNEVNCPEILPYLDMVDRLLEQLLRQKVVSYSFVLDRI